MNRHVIIATFCMLFVPGLALGYLPDAPATPPEPLPHRGPSGEAYTTLGRAEFVGRQALHGGLVGYELCIYSECSEPLSYGVAALGAGVGVGVSYLAITQGITSGRAQAINSGFVWGTLNGLLSVAEDSAPDTILVMLASQGIGMGLGFGYSWLLRPTGGQVALASFVGIWTSTAATSVALLPRIFNGPEKDNILLATRGAALAGLAAGTLWAHYVPMSRSRVFVMNLGVLVGGSVASTPPSCQA